MRVSNTTIQIVGIHVPTSDRNPENGYLFRPQNGLNIVYGKNGVGKSTLVRSLIAFSRQSQVIESPYPAWNEVRQDPDSNFQNRPRSRAEGGGIHVFFRAELLRVLELADSLADSAMDLVPTLEERSLPRYWGVDDLVKGFLHASEAGTDQDHNDEYLRGLAQLFDDIDIENIRQWATDPALFLADNTPGDSGGDPGPLLVYLTYQRMRGKWSLDSLNHLDAAVGETLENHYGVRSLNKDIRDEINRRFVKYDVPVNLVSDDQGDEDFLISEIPLNDKLVLFVDVVISTLEHELHDTKFDPENLQAMWGDIAVGEELRTLLEAGQLSYADVHEDSAEIITTVARALAEQVESPIFEMAYTRRRFGQWDYFLALDMQASHKVSSHLEQFQRLLDRLEAHVGSINGQTGEPEEISTIAIAEWLSSSAVLTIYFGEHVLMPPNGLPLLPIGLPLGSSDAMPLEIVDMDRGLDVEDFVRRVFLAVMRFVDFDGFILSGSGTEMDNSDFDDQIKLRLTEAFKPLGALLRSLHIGVRDCRLEFSLAAEDWVEGNAVRLRFTTEAGDVVFAELSSAQKYWTSAAIRLISESSRSDPRLVVADEPDQGLHERAANNVWSSLSSLGLNAVFSSHSIAALRTRGAHLHHIERGIDGAVEIGPVRLGEDVGATAERLGTTTYDLLSLKRLLVLVEGAHDVAVVNRLLERSTHSQMSDFVLVVPMRGVKNVASAADSVLATEFSDLNILVLVDNGRHLRFSDFFAELRIKSMNGSSVKELSRELSEFRRLSRHTFEERTLLDLVERAIHRGILARLHVFLLPVGDVVELLPISFFGLDASWEVLRAEHARDSGRDDFKSWLNEVKGGSISTRSIVKAIEHLEPLPPPLVRLLQEIELHCS